MVDPNKIKMELLPGVPQDIDRVSYYIYNELLHNGQFLFQAYFLAA